MELFQKPEPAKPRKTAPALRPATAALNGGLMPNPVTGAIQPDISMSVNNVFAPGSAGFSAEGADLADLPFLYARWTNPTTRALEARLAALEGEPRTIIVTAHHPLLGPHDDGKNPTIGGDAAFAAIAAAGAHAVMSGHVHVPFDELRTRGGKAMRMIGAGTLSTRLRHGAPASWRVITCEPGGVVSSELRLVTPVVAA